MIQRQDLLPIGSLLKPHGIKGEISVEMTTDIDPAADELERVALEIDGIFVPFFIESARDKTATVCLVRFDGIDDEAHASRLTGLTLYAFRSDVEAIRLAAGEDDDDDEDGFYLSDLIGYRLIEDNSDRVIGTIENFDDSTANLLLIVKPEDQDSPSIYVPLANEFITDIDHDVRTIRMDLPEGLLEI